MTSRLFPEGADNDAAHVALAAAHGMNYLVTWNFRHLVNVHVKARIERRIADAGLVCPVICTPEALGGPN